MDQLINYSDQIRSLAAQHLPSEAFSAAAAVAAAAIILGIVISVFGAKLAKLAFTVGMTLAGIAIGAALIPQLNVPQWLPYTLGAVVGAVLGFVLFRIWVGAVAAAVFAMAAVAYAGQGQFITALDRLDGSALAVSADGSPTFSVPTLEQQQEFQRLSVQELAGRFWQEVKVQDPNAVGRFRLFAAVAGIVGFAIGVLLSRMMLILCTSLVGTGLLLAGLFYMGQAFWPEAVRNTAPYGRWMALAAASFFLVSAILQSRLTHRPKKVVLAEAPVAKAV